MVLWGQRSLFMDTKPFALLFFPVQMQTSLYRHLLQPLLSATWLRGGVVVNEDGRGTVHTSTLFKWERTWLPVQKFTYQRDDGEEVRVCAEPALCRTERIYNFDNRVNLSCVLCWCPLLAAEGNSHSKHKIRASVFSLQSANESTMLRNAE